MRQTTLPSLSLCFVHCVRRCALNIRRLSIKDAQTRSVRALSGWRALFGRLTAGRLPCGLALLSAPGRFLATESPRDTSPCITACNFETAARRVATETFWLAERSIITLSGG